MDCSDNEKERTVCIPIRGIEKILDMLRLLQLCPPTFNQVIVKGDEAIRLSGIDEWSVNEGKAYSSDPVYLNGLRDLIADIKISAVISFPQNGEDGEPEGTNNGLQAYHEAWVERISKWLESVWPSFDSDEIRKRIDSSHPVNDDTSWSNKCHFLAMDLIHTRHSKSDIVNLVRWLLMGAASDSRINKNV